MLFYPVRHEPQCEACGFVLVPDKIEENKNYDIRGEKRRKGIKKNREFDCFWKGSA